MGMAYRHGDMRVIGVCLWGTPVLCAGVDLHDGDAGVMHGSCTPHAPCVSTGVPCACDKAGMTRNEACTCV